MKILQTLILGNIKNNKLDYRKERKKMKDIKNIFKEKKYRYIACGTLATVLVVGIGIGTFCMMNKTKGNKEDLQKSAKITSMKEEIGKIKIKKDNLDKFLGGIDKAYILSNSTNIDYMHNVTYDHKAIKSVTADGSKVDTKKEGTYEITYAIMTTDNKKYVYTRKVEVVTAEKAKTLANEGKIVWMSNNEVLVKDNGEKVEEKKETPQSTEKREELENKIENTEKGVSNKNSSAETKKETKNIQPKQTEKKQNVTPKPQPQPQQQAQPKHQPQNVTPQPQPQPQQPKPQQKTRVPVYRTVHHDAVIRKVPHNKTIKTIMFSDGYTVDADKISDHEIGEYNRIHNTTNGAGKPRIETIITEEVIKPAYDEQVLDHYEYR